MSLAVVAVTALLLSSARDGHWSGRLGTLRGSRVRDGRVGVNVSTCGGRDEWTARRASR